jgi:antitoxin CptB
MDVVRVTVCKEHEGHNENDHAHRSRLYWQCRRGMLELDLALQAFLDHHYDYVTTDERHAFEYMLNYPDQLLFEYIMGRIIPTDRQMANVVGRLRAPAPA